MDLAFLDRIMDINESIIEADSFEVIEELQAENQKVLDCLNAEISQAFLKDDKTVATQLLVKLKYYVNIEEKIKAFKIKYSEWFGCKFIIELFGLCCGENTSLHKVAKFCLFRAVPK